MSLPNQATLLEQRPMQGLWGRPLDTTQRHADDCRRLSARTRTDTGTCAGTKVRTRFSSYVCSHFHLDIEPIYLRLNIEPTHIAEDNSRWVQPENRRRERTLAAVAVKLLAEQRHLQKTIKP
ncbi:MAG: hypothetical protein CM15mP68_5820 [Pseudomonadota bacterium]|nr:MAG: hypothetical protein CM15mP68_5820 [Pseudomonadota bacterium]